MDTDVSEKYNVSIFMVWEKQLPESLGLKIQDVCDIKSC